MGQKYNGQNEGFMKFFGKKYRDCWSRYEHNCNFQGYYLFVTVSRLSQIPFLSASMKFPLLPFP